MHSCGLSCRCRMGLTDLLACEHRRISDFCSTPPKNNRIFSAGWNKSRKSVCLRSYRPKRLLGYLKFGRLPFSFRSLDLPLLQACFWRACYAVLMKRSHKFSCSSASLMTISRVVCLFRHNAGLLRSRRRRPAELRLEIGIWKKD